MLYSDQKGQTDAGTRSGFCPVVTLLFMSN